MSKKYVSINGLEFTELKPMHYNEINVSRKTLYDCYSTPSDAKRTIWRNWLQWFENNTESPRVGVASYNVNFFTIECEAFVPALDKMCYFYITSTRREIHELV